MKFSGIRVLFVILLLAPALLLTETHAFANPGKNSKQVEHAKDRLEIGPDVNEVVQKKNRPLTFREDGVRAPAWYYIKVSF